MGGAIKLAIYFFRIILIVLSRRYVIVFAKRRQGAISHPNWIGCNPNSGRAGGKSLAIGKVVLDLTAVEVFDSSRGWIDV